MVNLSIQVAQYFERSGLPSWILSPDQGNIFESVKNVPSKTQTLTKSKSQFNFAASDVPVAGNIRCQDNCRHTGGYHVNVSYI